MKTPKSPTRAARSGRLALGSNTLLLALGICLAGFIGNSAAAPGELDSNYGTGGISENLEPEIPGWPSGFARQADGKIVVVGQGNGGTAPTGHVWTIARYTLNGTLDSEFSQDGVATVDFGLNHSNPTAVAIQEDGKIVVGGEQSGDSNTKFTLVRLNSDGSLDLSFSGDGMVMTTIDSSVSGTGVNDEITSLLIQPDEMIVATGRTNDGGRMAAVRYTSTGNLDTSFGSGGIVRVGWESSGFNINTCTASALQPDGKILLLCEIRWFG